jgi:outer membrane protein TolC
MHCRRAKADQKIPKQEVKVIKMCKHILAKWVITLLFLFFFSKAFSQKRYELTVREAVELAFKNVADVKNAQLDYQIQVAQNREITGQALPQATGAASLSNYLQLPKILFPDASKAAIYDVLINEGLLPQSTKVPAPALQAISFFQPWNTSVSATLSQLLFQPDVLVGLQARKSALGYAQANVDVVKERVKDSAYRRYYAILIAEKQSWFLQAGIDRLTKLYHDDSIMYVNGFAERLDLDKVQVQLTNLQTSKSVLDNSINLAYAALKYAIGVSQKDVVVLKESLSNADIKQNILDDSFKYDDRKEMQALNYSRKLQQLDVKRNKMAYLPTVSASLSYTAQGQGQKFITNSNTFWLKNSLVGVNLSLPIFDGFQKKYRIQQAELNLQKVENATDNLKQVIDLQQTVSKESLKNALLNLDAQERNVQLAENVYNSTKKKFEGGVGSSFEVLQADNDWQTAQSNYFTALYNAIVAKISYQSSLGKLE